jgi:hypothetical protein
MAGNESVANRESGPGKCQASRTPPSEKKEEGVENVFSDPDTTYGFRKVGRKGKAGPPNLASRMPSSPARLPPRPS